MEICIQGAEIFHQCICKFHNQLDENLFYILRELIVPHLQMLHIPKLVLFFKMT